MIKSISIIDAKAGMRLAAPIISKNICLLDSGKTLTTSYIKHLRNRKIVKITVF